MDDTNEVLKPSANPALPRAVAPQPASAQNFGHPWLYRIIQKLYFERIALVYPERLPDQGPVLYVGLHRNGAVDGFVYHQVLRNPVFMISTQLRKNWFARLFFQGIAVTRTKDEGDRSLNEAALRQCLDHLRAGGELFVFPEGTSSLGPRHLPFKSGAAWLLLDYLERVGHPPLTVVPLGIHYECPWAFRSKVEVVVGMPISTELPPDATRIERLKLMKRRLQTALEAVGINVPSEEHQQAIQRMAYMATLGNVRSYFKSLKALESVGRTRMVEEWRGLEEKIQGTKLWRHQGVPLFPFGSVVPCLLALCLVSPVVLTAMAQNLPPLVAGWWAGKKFPDDRNVISLWRILVGVPAFVLWVSMVTATLTLLGQFGWLAAYLVVTYAGLKLYYQFKKLAVVVHNALRQPAHQSTLWAFHNAVLQSLAHENL